MVVVMVFFPFFFVFATRLFVCMISSGDRATNIATVYHAGVVHIAVQLCGGSFSSQSIANKAKSNCR